MVENNGTQENAVPQAGQPCTACKRPLDVAGYRRCSRCRQRSNENQKKKQAKRSLAGRCRNCGQESLPGRKLCGRCVETNKTGREKRLRTCERLCTRCGGGPLERYCRVCDKCVREKEGFDATRRARELKQQGLCPNCKRPLDPSHKSACRHCRDRLQRLRLDVKRRAIAMHGGHCAWCLASDLAALTLDHVNDDGAERRKEGIYPGSGTGFHLYCWVVKVGRQADFQVLCFSCQWLKRIYGKGYRETIGLVHGDGEGI